jgi:hypothetical protein
MHTYLDVEDAHMWVYVGICGNIWIYVWVYVGICGYKCTLMLKMRISGSPAPVTTVVPGVLRRWLIKYNGHCYTGVTHKGRVMRSCAGIIAVVDNAML